MAERFKGLLRASRGAPGVSPTTKGRLPNIGGYASYAGPSPKLGHVLDANTVALWRFNEAFSTSDAADETGNYPLSQFGNPSTLAGQVDGGRLLNGSSMFFQKQGDLPLGTVLNGDSSIEAWVKITSTPAAGVIFIYNGLDFTVNDSDVVLMDLRIGSNGILFARQWQTPISYSDMFIGVTPLSLNVWHHIALTRQLPYPSYFFMTFFIDGVAITNGYHNTPVVPLTGEFHYIGVGNYTTNAGLGNGAGFLNGVIDDMRISNIVRTPGEIEISYNRGLGG